MAQPKQTEPYQIQTQPLIPKSLVPLNSDQLYSRCDLFQFHDDTTVFLLSFALAIRLFKPFLLLLLPRSLSPSATRNHSLRCALRRRPLRANPRSSRRRPHCSRAGSRRVLRRAAISGPLRNWRKLIDFFFYK